jgi:hypothetical protein
MQYRREIAVACCALLPVLSVADGWAQEAPPVPPPVAPPTNFVRIENFGSLVSFFNLASGTVRIVAVVYPSSVACDSILQAVATALRTHPSKRLRAYVVMTPEGSDDSLIRALNRASENRDRRLVYLWDSNTAAASTFRSLVGATTEPATGVCFLYDTNARLALDPPAPTMWMNANPRLRGPAFDAQRLCDRAGELVRLVEAKASDAALSPQ